MVQRHHRGNVICVDCGNLDAAPFTLAYGDDSITLTLCHACVVPAMLNIAATVELFADNPYDKAIARLERKMHNGTGNDTDLLDLTRYRRLREDAKHRHPSGHTT
jgi:hypothetical protein